MHIERTHVVSEGPPTVTLHLSDQEAAALKAVLLAQRSPYRIGFSQTLSAESLLADLAEKLGSIYLPEAR